MRKPKPSPFWISVQEGMQKAIGYKARLKKYHYERAVQQVYNGKIKRIQDYKHYSKFLTK